MNLYATLILAFGMSMDAFAAAIGKGASLHRPTLKEALRTGLIFGVIEALTPLVGWAIGIAASQYVMAWDHWVAFGLLFILGARMIAEGIRKKECKAEKAPDSHGFWLLACTAVATSLDAMAVGVGLAVLAGQYRYYRAGHRRIDHDYGRYRYSAWPLPRRLWANGPRFLAAWC